MPKVELIVYGDPISKQRPKVSMANGVVRTYTPSKTMNYENRVAHEYIAKYQGQMFEVDEPIVAMVTFYFGLNKGDYGKKGLNKSGREKIAMGFATIKQDIDNLLKSVFDGLNRVCYPDDRQIVSILAQKVYTQDTPRVEIYLDSARKREEQ